MFFQRGFLHVFPNGNFNRKVLNGRDRALIMPEVESATSNDYLPYDEKVKSLA
jgi:hypothetical protein